MMRTVVALTLAVATIVVVGCLRTEHKIEAHITLDIRHIETQAEEVLDYVEGKSDTLPGLEPAGEPTSWLQRGFELLSPMNVAYAQELKSDSPRMTEIANALRANNAALSQWKKAGCLGENNRGYVELRDCEEASSAEKKNEAQQVLAEENKHRKALYAEVARLNSDQGVSVSTVESVYAMERLERAQSGEVVQLPPAGKDFDTFKSSAKGQALGDQATPGAWVTIP